MADFWESVGRPAGEAGGFDSDSSEPEAEPSSSSSSSAGARGGAAPSPAPRKRKAGRPAKSPKTKAKKAEGAGWRAAEAVGGGGGRGGGKKTIDLDLDDLVSGSEDGGGAEEAAGGPGKSPAKGKVGGALGEWEDFTVAPPPVLSHSARERLQPKDARELKVMDAMTKLKQTQQALNDPELKVIPTIALDPSPQKKPVPDLEVVEPTAAGPAAAATAAAAAPSSKAKVALKVLSVAGTSKPFKLPADAKLGKLFQAVERLAASGDPKHQLGGELAYDPKAQGLAFQFEGEKVNPNTTPEDLDLEDDDLLECNVVPKAQGWAAAHREWQVSHAAGPAAAATAAAAAPSGKAKVTLKVLSVAGTSKPFKLPADAKLGKLFQAVERLAASGDPKHQLGGELAYDPKAQGLAFQFEGEKVNPNTTPEDLDLEDDDLLECNVVPKAQGWAAAHREWQVSHSTFSAAAAPKPVDRPVVALKVQSSAGTSKAFKIYADDAVSKIMDAYSKLAKQGKLHGDKLKWNGRKKLVFSFDGDRLQPADTPAKLDMEDGDLIQVNL